MHRIQSARRDGLPPVYSKFIWVWMALSSFTLIEPSPYDILFVIFLAIGLLLTHVSFSDDILLPLISIGLFIDANLISMFFASGDMSRATIFFLITLYLTGTWFFFVGLLHRFRQSIVRVIFSGYLTAAVIAVTIGALAYFGVIPQAELFLLNERVAGLFKDPNVFGPFLIPVVLYSIFRFESKSGVGQFLWLAIVAILSVGVLLSFSRAAWGNYCVSVFLYFLLPPSRPFKVRAVKLSLIVLLLLPVVFFVLSQLQVSELLNQRLGIMHNYDYNRFGTQVASLKLAMANPLGIGPRQTEPMLAYSTHSLYVRVMTEYGLLGMTSFMYLLALTVVRSFRQNFTPNPFPYSAVITASLMGLLFNSFFIDTLHWRHLWLLLALPWIPLRSGVTNEGSTDSHQI